MRPDDTENILHEIERQSLERSERVRQLLREEGRDDLLADFDKGMKDIRLGLSSARGIWHALSAAQRRTLQIMATHKSLVRNGVWYEAVGGPEDAEGKVCLIATARNLCARNLIDPEGGAFDPEKRFAITEHGRFVLKHGPNEKK